MAATTHISIDQEQFCCSVCLDVLKDPVTIPCGHSYCLHCIEDYWNRSKNKAQYSCPQCREIFNPRPALSRNTVLAEVVQMIQATGVREAPPAQHTAKPEEVKCGVCAGRKNKAVKSCLTCVESYCETHLRGHEDRFHGRAHKMTAVCPLKEKLCPHHEKPLRSYCCTDEKLVCSQCMKERHKGHDTVSVLEERVAQQKKLEEASLKSVQKWKEVEKELRYVVRYIKHSTEAGLEESERIFSKLIRSIERQRSGVRELIRAQEKTAVGQAEELLEKTEKEIAELRRRDTELKKLSNTDDHIQFLQKCKSLHFPTKTVELPSTDVLPYVMYKMMRDGLADLKDRLGDWCDKELARVSDKVISLKEASRSTPAKYPKVKDTDVPSSSEPRTRSEFLHFHNDLTLDPNTANPFLSLSENLRGVTTQSESQSYPEHPDRFTNWAQVLCRAGVAGRCYWEVEWSGSGGVSVGVCYKGMNRSGGGSDCKLGHNSKSWSLDCSHSACSFQHNKSSEAVIGPCSNRIGLYLDFRAGTLSFYGISDTMVLLHKVKTTFGQPLYPGFWVGLGSTLKLCPHKAPA